MSTTKSRKKSHLFAETASPTGEAVLFGRPGKTGAVDGIRTRTIQLGKLACCRYTTTANSVRL